MNEAFGMTGPGVLKGPPARWRREGRRRCGGGAPVRARMVCAQPTNAIPLAGGARAGADGLGGAPRRGHNSAIGSLTYAADNASPKSSNASPNLPANYGAIRALALRTIPRNASPSRSGPRFEKHGAARSRPQPFVLKVRLRIIEAVPGTERHARPVLPPETTPGNCTGTGGRRDAVRAYTGILRRMRCVAGLAPFSPAGRDPGPFSHSTPFRPAIDRDPGSF